MELGYLSLKLGEEAIILPSRAPAVPFFLFPLLFPPLLLFNFFL
jgi:hypothetical protein